MWYINYAENKFSPLPEGIWNWYVNPIEFAGGFQCCLLHPFLKIFLIWTRDQ